jgi:hypothetical protein
LFIRAANDFKDTWEPVRGEINDMFTKNSPAAGYAGAYHAAITFLQIGDANTPITTYPLNSFLRLKNSIEAFRRYLPDDRIKPFNEAAEAVLGKKDEVNPYAYLDTRTVEDEKMAREEILKRVDKLINFATKDI